MPDHPMPPLLTPRGRAIHTLRSWLAEGHFTAGARLPGEVQLAATLGVTRGTLRRALAQLADEGALERRQNRGHIVRSPLQGTAPTHGNLCLMLAPERIYRETVSGHVMTVEFAAASRLYEQEWDVLSVPAARFERNPRPAPAAISGVIGGFHAEAAVLSPLIAAYRQAGVPVAVASDEPAFAACDRAIPDHESAMVELVQRLHARGRRRILRAWSLTWTPAWLQARNRGYERACHELGLTSDPLVLIPPFPEPVGAIDEQWQRRVRWWAGYLVEHMLRDRTTDAILTISDADAAHITGALRLCGIDPASDVDVCGFDNFWHASEERQFEPLPPLLTVDKGNHALGTRLAEMMLERRENPDLPPRRQVMPFRIVSLR